MIGSIVNWFLGSAPSAFSPAPPPEVIERPQLTPADIERALDRAGREEVFALMYSYGWGKEPGGAPLWVWNCAAQEVMRMNATARKPPENN